MPKFLVDEDDPHGQKVPDGRGEVILTSSSKSLPRRRGEPLSESQEHEKNSLSIETSSREASGPSTPAVTATRRISRAWAGQSESLSTTTLLSDEELQNRLRSWSPTPTEDLSEGEQEVRGRLKELELKLSKDQGQLEEHRYEHLATSKEYRAKRIRRLRKQYNDSNRE